jgi:diacylglycerol kinase
MSKTHSTSKSFVYASEGLIKALKDEPNLKIHFTFAILAITLAVILKLSNIEFAILTLSIGMVITLELINTMLEALVDLVSPEIKPQAKVAKDVSAAAVLMSAIVSLVIGALLFLPKILELL